MLTIALEGLNRSGKDTQLDLLVKEYRDRGLDVLYMKGAGSRSGRGDGNFLNPDSKYWNKLQSKAYRHEIDTKISNRLRLMATGKLQREIFHELSQRQPDLLLLNRNLITNHFMDLQGDIEFNLEDTIRRVYDQSRGLGPIFPDLTIILHSYDKNVYLDRARKTDDDGYRTNLLNKHFSLYERVLKNLDKSKFKYELFDSANSINNINVKIKSKIDRMLSKDT